MHRIDTSTATPDNKFTEGDPTVPVPATTVSADWLNAVQEELVAAIASAGLEPEKSDNTQLRQAIGKLISTAVDAARIHPATVAPKAPGTAAVGTSVKYAREDHVHPEQTSVSELETARSIDGVNFDGSAAITHYAECSTAAATAAKVVSLAGFTLVKGAKVTVRFTVTNTAANPTLNVNKTGAKAIQYRNAAITAGALAANRTYTFIYDGSSWELIGDLDTNTSGKAHVTQTWHSGSGWYRKWSDGFIEQGGELAISGDRGTQTLATPFTTTNYTVVFGKHGNPGSHYATTVTAQSKTTFSYSAPYGIGAYFIAKGY